MLYTTILTRYEMDNEVKAKIIELEKEIEHMLLGQYDQQTQRSWF